MPEKTIDSVLKEHTNELINIPGVVGTAEGVCGGEPCIQVLVVEKTPQLEEEIPDSIEGYEVEVQETGEIKAEPKK